MAATLAPDEQLRRYVETHHIDRIPEAARHGKPWHQFAFWWGGNVNVFNLVLGALTVSIGLSFWWALTAITVGTVIGATLIALHATQGPVLGVPQTIQSRAQFGFFGSAFLFPAVLLINVGFIAAQFVIQAQAMQAVAASVSVPQWILILAVPALVIGIFGYRRLAVARRSPDIRRRRGLRRADVCVRTWHRQPGVVPGRRLAFPRCLDACVTAPLSVCGQRPHASGP